MKALLRFELPSLPQGARLQSATLSLYTLQRTTDDPLLTQVYAVGRPWSEDESSWLLANAGEPWAQSGGEGPGADYVEPAVAVNNLTDDQAWYAWDVSDVVGTWLEAPETNQGLMYWAQGGEAVRYNLASADNSHKNLRPRLTITYLVS